MSELALKLIAEAKEKRLTTLDLGNCGLTEIPEELFELVWLEELSFSGVYFQPNENKKGRKWLEVESKNKGSRNQFNYLPQNFSKLRQLNKLILAGDIDHRWQISDVGSLSSLTKLVQLDLSFNQLSDVDFLYFLTKLIYLNLGFNQLIDVKSLSSLINLKRLTLINNQLIDVKPLSSLTNLSVLNLMNNQLTDVNPLSSLGTVLK